MTLREQLLKADRRVRCYLCLILLLTACVAIGLAVALPAWAEGREWLRSRGGEGAAGFLIVMLVEAAVIGPLLLLPFLAVLWVDRRLGLRCPACKRSVTLRGREVVRSGRCCWCQQILFEAGGGTAEPLHDVENQGGAPRTGAE
jgi:hypothetical protein